MRKAGLTVLLTGLFVLMLSTLVVTPEDAVPPSPVPLAPILHAVFLPMTEPPAPVTFPGVPEGAQAAFGTAMCAVVAAAWLTAPPSSDSNGRVLRACRYENSVYQVFRPEVAGG